jgi:MFS family permease
VEWHEILPGGPLSEEIPSENYSDPIVKESILMANKSVVDEVASSSADTIDRTRLRRSFWFVSFAFFVTMIGTTTPTPLYVLYQSRFHFSDGMITGVYAVYPLAVMLVLLGFGRLSDQIGRRKVLLTALGCAILSSIVFVFAQNLGWLFVGRFISGVSAGLVMGTATAALNELQPQHNTRFAALISTASNMLGLGVGPLLSGVLAQYTPWSTVTPYLAHIGLVILALLGLATIPETVRKQAAQASRRPQRVGIPNGIRFIFIVSAAAVFCAYSLLSLFTALAPTLVDSLIGIHNLVIGGAVVFIVFGFSALAQLLLRQVAERVNMGVGLVLLILGLVLMALALYTQSLVVFLLSAVFGGLGQGLSYMGSAMWINKVAPVDRRGEVNSAYFAVGYLGADLPVLGLGLASATIGIPSATLIFVIIVGVLAGATILAMLLQQALTRASSL